MLFPAEIQSASQTIFAATLDALSQAELEHICAVWSNALPRRNDTDKQKDSTKALVLLGFICTQRYTEMPPMLLKDVANAIWVYLDDDEDASHQAVAIILCDKGFSIFQHYFDAMEVVRSLFAISSVTKESSTVSGYASGTSGNSASNEGPSKVSPSSLALENRDLARAATLRIAEENTPLFMTTLSLDILHARSPGHCSATMRLVAFMVRRKPLILYPNLPRLAEAVVKSLDPTIITMRSVIHRSATIIISELVATYPTITFHKELQRLAVGTFEGAIIVYDLKTATRLYVLEAHRASLNGLAFSPDGRRLISLCLQDGMVKIWKTGTGIRNLFNFGVPRQAAQSFLSLGSHAEDVNHTTGRDTSSGTQAYKNIAFGHLANTAFANSGEDTHERLLQRLDLVHFEWLSEQSVKILVGEASMVIDAA